MSGSRKQRVAKSPHSDNAGDSLAHDRIWQDSSWRRRLRTRLLDWYRDNARTLPWRSDPTAYHVWVSEIMLQQTQVATVLPYFDRFVRRFPTVNDLADAPEQELLKHWEGLGYYRRARSLHAAAKQIVEQHDAVFPETFDEVLALPGVGRYTAGAILSISQGQRLPVLEANTQRVFSRWVALREPPTGTLATKLLWRIAQSMLPRRGSGEFNQAAMELGALICLPRDPQCDQCPVRGFCRAHRDALEDQIPGKLAKINYESRTEFAFVIAEPAGKYLMRPLPQGGRWAGLWDFPRPTDQGFDSAGAAAKWLSEQLETGVTEGPRLKTIKHAVTKYRISLHIHDAKFDSPRIVPPQPWQFVSVDEMNELPMSVTGRKIADLIACDGQQLLPL